uniref:diguanylate cyclase n=1 Tax=Candidatus Kentrum sp. LFY TaxID=2126342 RepID=A0A450WJ46_9GAMM|nr:MAG: diguanylate cyclase (GGDEF) domain-containing protein [Candidatus Kentron sp. LFY]
MNVAHCNHSGPSSRDFQGLSSRKRRILERTQAVLLTIAGSSSGKLFLLGGKPAFMIGCAEDCDIRLMDSGVSRQHAELQISKKGLAIITDLGSVGGTYVDGIAISRCAFQDGAMLRIGATDTLKFTYLNHLEKSFHLDQYRKTIYDDLTGVFNRRYFLVALRQELTYAHHHRQAISLILIDIDHFKRINDSRGHLAGDAVLEHMVAVIRNDLLEENIFARYGGEEFGIIVRGQGIDGAHALANRIRHSVAGTTFDGQKPFWLTISAGIASCNGECPLKDASEMLTEADKQLYRAKAAGGNRVFGEDPSIDIPTPA